MNAERLSRRHHDFLLGDRNQGSAEVLLTSLPGTFLPFTHC
jgi:hypothetical protein